MPTFKKEGKSQINNLILYLKTLEKKNKQSQTSKKEGNNKDYSKYKLNRVQKHERSQQGFLFFFFLQRQNLQHLPRLRKKTQINKF